MRFTLWAVFCLIYAIFAPQHTFAAFATACFAVQAAWHFHRAYRLSRPQEKNEEVNHD